MKILAYKSGAEQLFADEFPILPQDCPFGNLDIKYGFILTHLNLLNDTIEEIIVLDNNRREARKNHVYVDRETQLKSSVLKMRFCTEIKICTDELISLNFLLYKYYFKRKWPNQITVDSIGAVLSTNFKNGFVEFERFKNLFIKLNSIGNAIKHSFVNSESLWYRTYEPKSQIIGLYHKHNKLDSEEIELHEIELESFIEEYNEFLIEMKKKINQYE